MPFPTKRLVPRVAQGLPERWTTSMRGTACEALQSRAPYARDARAPYRVRSLRRPRAGR